MSANFARGSFGSYILEEKRYLADKSIAGGDGVGYRVSLPGIPRRLIWGEQRVCGGDRKNNLCRGEGKNVGFHHHQKS
jgi:hypothetical protein